MIVHAVSSAPAPGGVRDLVEVLTGRGHRVRVHDVARGPDRGTRDVVRRLVRELRLSGQRDGEPVVLHALDAGAWVPLLMAGRSAGLPVVLQAGPQSSGRFPASWITACLCSADAVAVTSSGLRRALVRSGVPGDRILVVPEVVLPLRAPVVPPPGAGSVVYLDDEGAGPPADLLRALDAAVPGLRLPALTGGPGGTSPRANAARLDDADLAICAPSARRSAIQAMWRGRPVVTQRSGVMRDVVIDGHTGELVPSCSAGDLAAVVGRLLGSPFRVQAEGLAGRERAEACFDLSRTAPALEHLHTLALLSRSGRLRAERD